MAAPSTPPLRIPIVAGNWKMNYGPSEARDFVEGILPRLAAITSVERVLCPPAISLAVVHAIVTGSGVEVGAQNMYFEPKGAYTGETSPTMLQGIATMSSWATLSGAATSVSPTNW